MQNLSLSTETSQQLQDFSQSFANLALSRNKTRKSSFLSSTNLPSPHAQPQIPVAKHRKSASIAQKPRFKGFHKRTFSTNPENFEDFRETREFCQEIRSISREIKERERNYREISRFLRSYAEELQGEDEKLKKNQIFLAEIATFSPKAGRNAGFLCCGDTKCVIF